MPMPEAQLLAESPRCSMVAAAGCGKTHVIAEAVARHANGRQLVLTHTHSGVDALRARLRRLGGDSSHSLIDTIAAWSFRLAAHFPRTSGVVEPAPADDEGWNGVYAAATALVGRPPIREMLRASYAGMYVDEYQDCSRAQHDCIVALSEVLPCRVLGDPLQGIFEFREPNPTFWHDQVEPRFQPIPGPVEPRRWETTNPELGTWLQAARRQLERNQPVDLRGSPARWLQVSGPRNRMTEELRACRAFAGSGDETVVAILKWRNQAHSLAQRLNGIYSCIEPVESLDLFQYAAEIHAARGPQRAAKVLEFAGICMTQVRTQLGSIATAFEAGREPGIRVRLHPVQREALLRVSREDSIEPVLVALDRLAELRGAIVYRRELFYEMRSTLRAAANRQDEALVDIAREVRRRTRIRGRRFPLRAVGTTLLVKGLEFDHVVVLGPEQFDAKHLYVALTRGRRSLTVVSSNPVLTPA